MKNKDRQILFAKLVAEKAYKCCEKGLNLEATLEEIEKLIKGNY